MAYCRESYRGIVEFCRSRDVIAVPDDPLEIEWTPPFLREFAGAMLDSPGPLDKGQKAFYFMTPPPDDWTPDQVESYLAEENDRQIDLTTIHEGTPGHLPSARLLEPLPIPGQGGLRRAASSSRAGRST